MLVCYPYKMAITVKQGKRKEQNFCESFVDVFFLVIFNNFVQGKFI